MDTNKRWCNLWRAIGAISDPKPVWERLVPAYGQAYRSYHTLDHIQACLKQLDWAREIARRPDILEVAIWFHDVVYDTHAQDNEEQSAAWATRELQHGSVAPEMISSVHKLILETKHTQPPVQPDESLLLDIDLSIFGRESVEFDHYEMLIRREYNWVPEITYCEARAEILESFLRRTTIYNTSIFQVRYETQARDNLARSIRRLRSLV
jgi:predicted metal-dependent HD superfamily phosphohydrolase